RRRRDRVRRRRRAGRAVPRRLPGRSRAPAADRPALRRERHRAQKGAPMRNDESPGMRLNRRMLLRQGLLAGAALGVAPAFLDALGGRAAAASEEGASASGTIDFFSWQGYDLLSVPVMKSWRKANHVTIHSTYVNTHNDITAKFTTGGGKGI